MKPTFFAAMSRMKYIERWALMRSTRPENLCEHSMEVAMIAHALCTIGNIRYGRHLDAERAAVLGLFHDAPEIITGDLPTPVKHGNREMHDAYLHVEQAAIKKLLSGLPDDLKSSYAELMGNTPLSSAPSDEPGEPGLGDMVKAADRISALIKCIEEERSGNTEFSTARVSVENKVEELCRKFPEVKDFVSEFLPSYGNTLDELMG